MESSLTRIEMINCSIIIPIYNEEKTVSELWRRLYSVMKDLDGVNEVIFVNDGSVDSTFELLKDIYHSYPEVVKIIDFSRNFGHQCALSAGLEHAEGDVVIMMDGDLQDAPEVIPAFINSWREGYDVVYAIRKNRKENFLKRALFKLFYRIQSILSGLNLPLDAGIFSLLDRKVVLTLRQMPERNKYISGLRAYAGFQQTGILVERDARHYGNPKVTLAKLFKLAFDGIFAFSTIPLKLATYLGLTLASASFMIGLIGLYFKFVLRKEFLGWAYGLTTTFFLGGIQLVCLGIIGEYIGRIYEEVRQRPYYIIGRKFGFMDQSETVNR